ncbi:hypothetical protein E4U55_001016 [Claviceps digitariae]|nr:hypothetical protein E4U55_001016 [Claviceps digitariae]
MALSSTLSPFSLPQISLERSIEAGSTRTGASSNVSLALHSQAKRDNSGRGHNTIAIALGISIFRRILESSVPNFGLHRATALTSFASEVLSPRLCSRRNSGPAALSKMPGTQYSFAMGFGD